MSDKIQDSNLLMDEQSISQKGNAFQILSWTDTLFGHS